MMKISRCNKSGLYYILNIASYDYEKVKNNINIYFH